MGKSLSALRQQIMSSGGASLDEERLRGFFALKTPPVFLDGVVEAMAGGASDTAAAMCGGLTRVEMKAMLEWGRAGHPGYVDFWRMATMARGSRLAEVHRRVSERGDLASDLVANRWMGGEDEKAPGGMVQNQVNVVIRRDFGEVVEGEVDEGE